MYSVLLPAAKSGFTLHTQATNFAAKSAKADQEHGWRPLPAPCRERTSGPPTRCEAIDDIIQRLGGLMSKAEAKEYRRRMAAWDRKAAWAQKSWEALYTQAAQGDTSEQPPKQQGMRLDGRVRKTRCKRGGRGSGAKKKAEAKLECEPLSCPELPEYLAPSAWELSRHGSRMTHFATMVCQVECFPSIGSEHHVRACRASEER